MPLPPYLDAAIGALVVPQSASWRALVSSTIVIIARPMSDRQDGATPEVRLPLHLDGVGDVDPLRRRTGAVDHEVHARIAIGGR